MTERYAPRNIRVNNVNLRYLDWGTTGKMPLICLHGNTRHAHIWDEFAETMSSQYHVYAIDQRGHGESEWAVDGYHRDKYVSDLAAFMDSLYIESVVLVGLSMGGWNSLLYAADNPHRVERFIMVDIAPEGSSRLAERRQHWQPAPLEMDTFEDALDWARKDDPWCTEERRLRDVRDRIRQHTDGKWRWKCDPVILTTFLPDNVNPEYIDRYWKAMEKVECPFIEVRGKVQIGKKYFGISFEELGDEFPEFQRGRVESGKITVGSLGTIRSQITRHILPYIGAKTKVGSITSSAFYDYAQYRRKKSEGVQEVTIRNEYTIAGALLKFFFRLGYVNTSIESLDFEEIKITKGKIGRRDTITLQEYDWLTRYGLPSWAKQGPQSSNSNMMLLKGKQFVRDFILIMANSGLRVGESRQLQ